MTRKATAPTARQTARIRPAEVEETADDENEDDAGEQGRVGAVAGEVLARRGREAAEAGEHDADAERGRVLADDADRQHDDAGEHGQLGQWEVAPRCRRPLLCPPSLAQRPQAARITGIPMRP